MRSKSLGQPIIPWSAIFKNDLMKVFSIGTAVAALLVAIFSLPIFREQLAASPPLSLFTLLIAATYLITFSAMIVARFYLKKVAQIRAFSDRDELTGLYIRTQFDRALKYEANRSVRYSHPLSLLLLGIDQYDEVSKNVGLREAKLILKQVGQIISQEIRNTDLGFLYKDNNTFAILLTATNAKRALIAAKRICHATSKHVFRNLETGEIIHVKLSIAIKQLDNKTIAQSIDSTESHIERFKRRTELLLNQAMQRGNTCLTETPNSQHVTS